MQGGFLLPAFDLLLNIVATLGLTATQCAAPLANHFLN